MVLKINVSTYFQLFSPRIQTTSQPIFVLVFVFFFHFPGVSTPQPFYHTPTPPCYTSWWQRLMSSDLVLCWITRSPTPPPSQTTLHLHIFHWQRLMSSDWPGPLLNHPLHHPTPSPPPFLATPLSDRDWCLQNRAESPAPEDTSLIRRQVSQIVFLSD